MDSMMDKTRARRVRMLWAGTALALGAALAGCGGGGEDTGSGGTTPSPSPAPTPTPPVETLELSVTGAQLFSCRTHPLLKATVKLTNLFNR